MDRTRPHNHQESIALPLQRQQDHPQHDSHFSGISHNCGTSMTLMTSARPFVTVAAAAGLNGSISSRHAGGKSGRILLTRILLVVSSPITRSSISFCGLLIIELEMNQISGLWVNVAPAARGGVSKRLLDRPVSCFEMALAECKNSGMITNIPRHHPSPSPCMSDVDATPIVLLLWALLCLLYGASCVVIIL